MNSIKLSVFTTCYNQELYIREAIESVMNQSVQPYEYIICDDCSKDNTWEIVQEYQKRFPDIIKAYRNEINLGLYSNFNYAQSLVTGNLITCVSGDDLILPGSFEDIVNTIQSNSLDPEEDSFMIISNIVNLFENGNKTNYSNYRYRNKNLFSLRLRYILDDRFSFVSKKSFQNTEPFKTDIGLHADFLWGFDRIIKTEKFIFIDKNHHVYRVGVGVASKTNQIHATISHLNILNFVYDNFKNFFSNADLKYFKYIITKDKYLIDQSYNNYFNLFYCTLINLCNFWNKKKLYKAMIFVFIPKFLKRIFLKNKFILKISK